MQNLLLILLLSNFVQKWNINKGTDCLDRMLIGDTDRDTCYELIFTSHSYSHMIHICELHLPNHWSTDSFFYSATSRVEAIGDFDSDGLYDLLVGIFTGSQQPYVISVFESPDSFSYPIQEVWRDTLWSTGLPYSVYDVDGDGRQEILISSAYDTLSKCFWIYENIGNNQYQLIYKFHPDTTLYDIPGSTHAFGDFDCDGRIEFAMGGSCRLINTWVYESPANNTYEKVFELSLPTGNFRDCFSVTDADQDGKMEFVIKGFTVRSPPYYTITGFIFEAISNNLYGVLKSFSHYYGQFVDYNGGYSDAGDVDGDSIPEILLESCQVIYIIKSAGNDSFFVWQTLPGNHKGSSVRVFDLDRNGLNEIIISGENSTRIYEKTPEVTWFCPEPFDTFWANDTVYPRWRLDETIVLDSLRIYWAHPQMGCHLIYQGLPTDTICQWVVPDTQSNMSNRFWLVVKGFGRYDSTYSPVFYIRRPTGIEEPTNPPARVEDLVRIPQLEIYPNPVHNKLTINYALAKKTMVNLSIYDASGRLIEVLVNEPENCGFHQKRLNVSQLPQGVYFVHLHLDENYLMRKFIVVNNFTDKRRH